MRLTKLFLSVILITGSLIITSCHQTKVYKVYYLGGQSNMDGYGYVKDLPPELNKPVDGIMIFHGNQAPDGVEPDGKGIWATLRPGNGTEFTSDGKVNNYSERFGVELTFAIKMKELDPGSNFAIIKYSRNGSSIDPAAAGNFGCWEENFTKGNGINQWDHFLATLKYAYSYKDIDGDGHKDKLVPAGIVWMQGESDGSNEKTAMKYEENLRKLMGLFRKAFHDKKMPVVIGRISDSGKSKRGKVWEFGDIIRTAQAEFVKKDGRAVLVTSTDSYGYSDTWHYNSAGYIDLGNQFAEALFKISK